MKLTPRQRKQIAGAAIALVALAVAYFSGELDDGASRPAQSAEARANPAGVDAIAAAFAARRSDVWVEAGGRVKTTLADDNDGSRHQRFLVELANGQTILIAHNIDLAQKVPLREGDTVRFRGEYEWNDRGGVVHWTHHDPRGRKRGGWISHRDKTYK